SGGWSTIHNGLVWSTMCLRRESFHSYLTTSSPSTILQATTSSARYRAPQEYSRLGGSLSEEASPPGPHTPLDNISSPATGSRSRTDICVFLSREGSVSEYP